MVGSCGNLRKYYYFYWFNPPRKQPPAVVSLTYSVEQLSSGAVLQEQIHSSTFLSMAKKTNDVGVFEHLPEQKQMSISAHTR